MTVANSNRRKRPDKPFPEYPLFPHNNGQWCRKIRGTLYSFGLWGNPSAALEKHNREYPYHKAGVPLPDKFDGLNVGDLCNKFLAVKDNDRASGEITERWFADLKKIGELIVANIDRDRPVESLGPDDFRKLRSAIVKKHSPTITRNMILRVKSFFRFAWENQLINKPVRYGDAFKAPRRAQERKHRADKGPKVFTPAQVKTILGKCNRPMKAACLLMLNCGLSNSDVCKLPVKAIDLEKGWLNYPRPKTGIDRRGKLWPETISAIRDYLDHRPNEALPELVFVTRFGQQWNRHSLSHEFTKVATKSKLEFGSPEWFRKSCQTIGEGAKDFIALKRVMGHADDSISDHYRERVDDKRLEDVSKYLHTWLFGKRKRGAK